jgi:hypothetical protein
MKAPCTVICKSPYPNSQGWIEYNFEFHPNPSQQDNLFKIISLPRAFVKSRPFYVVHARDLFVGGNGFEHTDHIAQYGQFCWDSVIGIKDAHN